MSISSCLPDPLLPLWLFCIVPTQDTHEKRVSTPAWVACNKREDAPGWICTIQWIAGNCSSLTKPGMIPSGLVSTMTAGVLCMYQKIPGRGGRGGTPINLLWGLHADSLRLWNMLELFQTKRDEFCNLVADNKFNNLNPIPAAGSVTKWQWESSFAPKLDCE